MVRPMALIVPDAPAWQQGKAAKAPKNPPPIVTERFQFLEDYPLSTLTSGVATLLVVMREAMDAGAIGFGTSVSVSHNGYAGRYGLTHRRILILRDDGTELRGEDPQELADATSANFYALFNKAAP